MRILPLLLIVLSSAFSAAAEKPNIVFILADDLGIGDVKCFNPDGKIATPNMDRLASLGMKLRMRTRLPPSARRRATA